MACCAQNDRECLGREFEADNVDNHVAKKDKTCSARAMGRGKKRKCRPFSYTGTQRRPKSLNKTTDGNQKYEVEKILDDKILKNGKRMFKLQWKDFSKKMSTWVPEDNLECDSLLLEYMLNKHSQDFGSRS